RLARHDPRHLMVAVPIPRRAGEHGDDDLRPERSNDGHDILHHRVVWPVLEGLRRALREAEVVRAREVLLCAIDAPSGEQFLCADDAERRPELVADEVLTTIAAGEREVRRLDVTAEREPGDEPRVLVIGMRADHEY